MTLTHAPAAPTTAAVVTAAAAPATAAVVCGATSEPHLTRILLDPRTRNGRADLQDAASLHRLTMRLAPETLGSTPRQEAGVLFRLDDTPAGPVLLVQTAGAPRLDRLAERGHQTASRPLGPLLDRLLPGLRVAYRIAANPTRRDGNSRPETKGKLQALTGQDALEWWARRAADAGLGSVLVDTTSPAPALTGISSNGQRFKHAVTVYTGTAVVTDPDALRTAISIGVGRGKAHGAGLLTIAALDTN